MRTKALVLAAAFAAAGVATSMAQAVYSVNAVGYVNTTLLPGFNLISNPLNAADNKIGTLFKNVQGGAPGGLTVYVFEGGQFKSAQYDDLEGTFSPADVADKTTIPGDGVFCFLPSGGGNKILTFVGEVVQGNTTTPIARGFSIKSSVVPQKGKPDAFGLPAAGGDLIFRYNSVTRGYKSFQFDDLENAWSPPLEDINVGEAFFYFRTGAATNWTRTFNVNSQ
jgi:nitrogen fixation-related uncharacterized protein